MGNSKINKNSKDGFIQKCIKIYGDKYDFSKMIYTNRKDKIEVICKEHNISFFVYPRYLLRGTFGKDNCEKCVENKKVEDKIKKEKKFIDDSIEIYGNLYDYSDVNYVAANKKVIIKCNKHLISKKVMPTNFKRGIDICNKCKEEQNAIIEKKVIIKMANDIYNNRYDYSKMDYKDRYTIINVICDKHGIFQITPDEHIRENGGCPHCSDYIKIDLKKPYKEECVKLYGNKYDYSNSILYKNNIKKIYCNDHKLEFNKLKKKHMNNKIGCNECERIKDEQIFIYKAIEIHGDNYDYSNVNYVKATKNVKIKCNIHDIYFNVHPTNHIHNKSGCKGCANIAISNKLKLPFNEFLKRANKKHGNKYDYSKVKYTMINDKVEIICPIEDHGSFFQEAKEHINSGHGCNKCGIESRRKTQSLSFEEFIIKANVKHGNKYEYVKDTYTTRSEYIKIICPIEDHGSFLMKPKYHLLGFGCINCSPNHSNYSKDSLKWLQYIENTNNIKLRTAISKNGEYRILNTRYFADGFNKENNTIYEYHGDMFHGNPKFYDPNEKHPICTRKLNKNESNFWDGNPIFYDSDDTINNNEKIRKKYLKNGYLMKRTIHKELIIRNNGYNYVSIWEHQWKLLSKKLKQ